ncbi:MAG: hypothetical protein ACRDD3_00970, partial [Azovibrio sp.]
FFTDLDNKNVMDKSPFLIVDFEEMDHSLAERLFRFRHDEFRPEALRTLAEETVYLNAFTEVISNSLRNPDIEFVKFVANRAGVQRQFNAKFLETISPIVKLAVERSVSDMVVSGLSAKPQITEPKPMVQEPVIQDNNKFADIIDPENNKIVTSYAERRLIEVVKGIVGDSEEIAGKDTETYYSVLFQGKVNRWLVRYHAEKRSPYIQICVPMTEERKHEVERAGMVFGINDCILLPNPEHLFRISGIVFDALKYAKDDANFKRQTPAL